MTMREEYEKNNKRLGALDELFKPIYDERSSIENEQQKLRPQMICEEKLLSSLTWRYTNQGYRTWVIACGQRSDEIPAELRELCEHTIHFTDNINIYYDTDDGDMCIHLEADATTKEILSFLEKYGITVDFSEIDKAIWKAKQEAQVLMDIAQKMRK